LPMRSNGRRVCFGFMKNDVYMWCVHRVVWIWSSNGRALAVCARGTRIDTLLVGRDRVTVIESVSSSTFPNVHFTVHLCHRLTLSNTLLTQPLNGNQLFLVQWRHVHRLRSNMLYLIFAWSHAAIRSCCMSCQFDETSNQTHGFVRELMTHSWCSMPNRYTHRRLDAFRGVVWVESVSSTGHDSWNESCSSVPTRPSTTRSDDCWWRWYRAVIVCECLSSCRF